MTTLAFSRRPSLAFSDFGSDDGEHIDANGADYSTRMGELFDDEDETPTVSVPRFDPDEDGENDEAFIYDGVDAQVSRTSYREQLRDVLDEDGEDADDDELEEREVERSLVHDLGRPPITIEDEALVSPLVSIRHACLTLISRGRMPSPPSLLFAISRTHPLSALNYADTFPLDYFRLPLLPTRNVLFLTKRCLLFNTLKAFPVLHTPVYLAFTLLHDARITCHLRDECKLPFPPHLFLTCPVQLYAFTWLFLLAPRTPRRCREARLFADEWTRSFLCARSVPVGATACPWDASPRATPLKQGTGHTGCLGSRRAHGHGRERTHLHRHREWANTCV